MTPDTFLFFRMTWEVMSRPGPARISCVVDSGKTARMSRSYDDAHRNRFRQPWKDIEMLYRLFSALLWVIKYEQLLLTHHRRDVLGDPIGVLAYLTLHLSMKGKPS